MDSWDKKGDLKMLDVEKPLSVTHTMKVSGHKIVQLDIDELQRLLHTIYAPYGGWLVSGHSCRDTNISV